MQRAVNVVTGVYDWFQFAHMLGATCCLLAYRPLIHPDKTDRYVHQSVYNCGIVRARA